MIRFLINVPIKRKLTIIAMFTTTLALGVACVAFTIYDQIILRRDLVRDLSSTAAMLGFSSAPALAFNDPRSAGQTLHSLAAHPHIVTACLYRRDGSPFTLWSTPVATSAIPACREMSSNCRWVAASFASASFRSVMSTSVVLNSVNVSATLLTNMARQSKITHVTKLADLLAAQHANLSRFLADDPRGQKVPGFLQTLSSCLAQEQREVFAELESLRRNIEHIKEIVARQQSYARVSGVSERLAVVDLVEDAISMSAGAFARDDVVLVRDFQVNPCVTLEKHKVLQILVNVLRNAKHACDDSGRSGKQIIVRVTATTERVRIAVIDNGVGIPAENLIRIFAHGFTTRKQGHGFGLHSGALAAKELGGSLLVESEGIGRGATFILELPLREDAKAA